MGLPKGGPAPKTNNMTTRKWLKNAKAFRKDIYIISMDILVDTSDGYLDIQRDQLNTGFNKLGQRIGVYASPTYENEKKKLNPIAGGWVDLKLTGDWQTELTIRKKNNLAFYIYSQDIKNNDLFKKYGEKIVGLTPENNRLYYNRFFREKFFYAFRQYMRSA